MGLGDFFKKIYGGLKSVFSFLTSKDNQQKAEAIIKQIHDLADFAVPAVQTVLNFVGVGNSAITTEIMTAITRMNLTVGEVLDEPNGYKKAGILLNLASEVVREKLLSAVTTSTNGVKFGDKILKTADDVLNIALSLLNGAVQPTYTLYKGSQ